MSTNDLYQDDEIIPQNHERGPGWFLIATYTVVTLVCIYYFFTYRDWKSSYEIQQQQIQEQLKK